MTPLHLEILMHYATRGNDMENLSNGTVREYLNELIREGMIEPRVQEANTMSSYQATTRGAVWLDAILDTPFPIQTWTVPARKP